MNISVLFSYTKKNYPFQRTKVSEREIQPHEMVKYLCERVAVL